MRSLIQNNSVEVLRIALKSGNVKFTDVSIEYFKNHPQYPSLQALKDTLESLSIQTATAKISFSELRENLTIPTIIHSKDNGGMFALVKRITDDEVVYYDENLKEETQPLKDFINAWTSIAMFIKFPEKSVEADYRKNLLSGYRDRIGNIVLLCIAVFSIIYVSQQTWIQDYTLIRILLFSKLLGLFFSSLLIYKNLSSNSQLLDTFCGGGSTKVDCNSILSSQGSTFFFGLISWSDVGLVYFLSTLISLALPGNYMLVNAVALLALLSLSYVPYSLYYQWKVVSKWCTLCLAVQLVILVEGVVVIASISSIDLNAAPKSYFIALSILLLLVIITSVLLTTFRSGFTSQLRLRSLEKQLNKLKFDPFVISQKFKNSKKVSEIDFRTLHVNHSQNNHEILIVTNPVCVPCKEKHRELVKILDQNASISFREIFLPQNKASEGYKAASVLVSETLNSPSESALKTYTHYFDSSVNQSKAIIRELEHKNSELIEEATQVLDLHIEWCLKNQISETPTVILNGKVLPDIYQLNDLEYLLKSIG